MSKRVIIIASGRTERSALPNLLRHLQGITVLDVRIPAHNRHLTPEQAKAILRAAWFEAYGRGDPPTKFVVLVDADGNSTESVCAAFSDLPQWVRDIPAAVLVTAAKWHLEAWFFGDEQGLRAFLGGSLGNVDASSPDDILNPKHHLTQLLAKPYTARIAGEIAECLHSELIGSRSPSFAALEQAVMNGSSHVISASTG